MPRQGVPTGRYRASLEDQTNFTDDIYGIANLTKLSDQYVMQDFFQGEFRIDPVPDNVIAVTKTDPFYTLTAIERFQANQFFTTTERQPEVVLDIKRHGLFGGPIFYEGETGFANLRLQFPKDCRFRELWHGPFRHLPPINLSKHLLWVAFDRATGWLSRNLLWQDMGPGIDYLYTAIKSARTRLYSSTSNAG